jgi:uncharacterized OB-fold protein
VSKPLELQVCEGCGRALFPARALCPGCGGRDFRSEPAGPGVVEEVTARLLEDASTVHIASVRLAQGPVVIARSPDQARGAEVALFDDNGAPVVTQAN